MIFLKVYMIVTAAGTYMCGCGKSQTGLIVNLQYEDPNKGIRNSMGTIYPTDFGAHIFYLAVAWVCYRNKALTWLEIGIISAVTIVAYVLSAPVTSARPVHLLCFLCVYGISWQIKRAPDDSVKSRRHCVQDRTVRCRNICDRIPSHASIYMIPLIYTGVNLTTKFRFVCITHIRYWKNTVSDCLDRI